MRIEAWLDGVASWPLVLVVMLVIAAAFGETAFLADLVVPGEVVMVILGAALIDSGWPAVAVAAVAGGVGAALGDLTSFVIGRHFTHRAEQWRWFRRRVEPTLKRAREAIARRGVTAIVVARLVGALRAIVPFALGGTDVRVRTLLWWSSIASVLWPAWVLVAGALFGRAAIRVVDRAEWAALGVALIVTVFVLRRNGRARSERSAPVPR
jgi:membrane protein DedA with SNARE-associated domain